MDDLDRARARTILTGCDLLMEQAKEIGSRVGIDQSVAAIQVLEVALARAYAEASLYLGANDSPQRLQIAIDNMTRRIAEKTRLAFDDMKGGKYLERWK